MPALGEVEQSVDVTVRRPEQVVLLHQAGLTANEHVPERVTDCRKRAGCGELEVGEGGPDWAPPGVTLIDSWRGS